MLYEKVKKLSKKTDKNLQQIALSLGFSKNLLYRWKDLEPKARDVKKVADYFNVSMDYLMDRTDEPSFLSTEFIRANKEEKEFLDAFYELPKDTQEKIKRYTFDLQTDFHKNKYEKIDMELDELIAYLLTFDDLVIQSLASKANWMIEVTGGITNEQQILLDTCYLLINLERTKTAEFVNLKKNIFETIIPPNYFVIAYSKNIDTVGGIAKRYHFSLAFIIMAITFYTTSRGSIFIDNDYLFDFNNVPSEFNPQEEKAVAKAKFSITDTDTRRAEAFQKKKKISFFSKKKTDTE